MDKALKWIGILLVGWTMNDIIAAVALGQHPSGRILDEGIVTPRVHSKNWPQFLNITTFYTPHRRLNEQTLAEFASCHRDKAGQEGLSARLLTMAGVKARPKGAGL